jgi:hypothetical protein
MFELVRALETRGFGSAASSRIPAGLPIARSLQVQVRGGRAQVAAPLAELPGFDVRRNGHPRHPA